jgi:hypothetical protein
MEVAAVTFIEAYADGWRDSWNGPGGAALNSFFHHGQRVLASYGMTPFDDSDGSDFRSLPARVGSHNATRQDYSPYSHFPS